jgi:hypothetical protein
MSFAFFQTICELIVQLMSITKKFRSPVPILVFEIENLNRTPSIQNSNKTSTESA